jgi:hypothetical protein
LGGAYIAWTSYILTWYFDILCMCECSVLRLPSFQADRKSSPTIPLLFSHHDVSPWALMHFLHNLRV